MHVRTWRPGCIVALNLRWWRADQTQDEVDNVELLRQQAAAKAQEAATARRAIEEMAERKIQQVHMAGSVTADAEGTAACPCRRRQTLVTSYSLNPHCPWGRVACAGGGGTRA